MSWQDNLKQAFSVTMGDGSTFTPLWDPQRSVVRIDEFNISKFNFIGVKGTLVDRAEVMGSVYDIELIFQGANHLIDAAHFRKSSRDKRPWTINHPYYDSLFVQPVGLKYNNEEGNITRITGQVIETLTAKGTNGIDPFDKIAIDKLNVDTALFASYLATVPLPKIADIQGMTANISSIGQKTSFLIKLSDDYNKFQNAVNTANYWAAQASAFPGTAIANIQALISAPALFIDSVVNRLSQLSSAYAALYNYVNYGIGKTIKRLYENNAGTSISSMCLAAVTGITNDYSNMPAVISVTQTIVNTYNDYLANLDALQSPNGSEVESYIPDVDSMNALSSLVSYTVSQLLIIAASAKQQQTFILPEDDNVETLAYRLYGSSNDDIVDQLIADNAINFRELLIVKKGREIIYYT